MKKLTLSKVKNNMRRGIRDLWMTPTIGEVDRMRVHFNLACAYCETDILKSDAGHADHLIPSSAGGSNHISNRVLACVTCNSYERLDRPWEEHLRWKCKDDLSVYEERRKRILDWKELALSPVHSVSPAFDLKAKEVERVILEYEHLYDELRTIKSQGEARVVAGTGGRPARKAAAKTVSKAKAVSKKAVEKKLEDEKQ